MKSLIFLWGDRMSRIDPVSHFTQAIRDVRLSNSLRFVQLPETRTHTPVIPSEFRRSRNESRNLKTRPLDSAGAPLGVTERVRVIPFECGLSFHSGD